MLDLSHLTWPLLYTALALIGLGVVTRLVAVFLLSFMSRFKWRERLFMSVVFSPKATVQAALAPVLVALMVTEDSGDEHASMILQTCILSILVTAPLGQMAIYLLGRLLLSSSPISNEKEIKPRGRTESGSVSSASSKTGRIVHPVDLSNPHPGTNGSADERADVREAAIAPRFEHWAATAPPISPEMGYREWKERRLADLRAGSSSYAGSTRVGSVAGSSAKTPNSHRIAVVRTRDVVPMVEFPPPPPSTAEKGPDSNK